MYLLGYSLNNFLSWPHISTGFVVDDAIVMIENISVTSKRRSPLQAALKGSEQIGFTILSLTISLIAVLIRFSLWAYRWTSIANLPSLSLSPSRLGSGFSHSDADDVRQTSRHQKKEDETWFYRKSKTCSTPSSPFTDVL